MAFINPNTNLAKAYRQYLKSRHSRLFAPDGGPFATLSADILELVADNENIHAGVFAFMSAQYRLDPHAATIQGIAVSLGGRMEENTDQAYEQFLLKQANLDGHERREEFVALARQIAVERDWGTRLYRFTLWLTSLRDEDEQ